MKKLLSAILFSIFILCSCSSIQNDYSALSDDTNQSIENETVSEQAETYEPTEKPNPQLENLKQHLPG